MVIGNKKLAIADATARVSEADMADIKKMAQGFLGDIITDAEYVEALPRAEVKLSGIVEREGDLNGLRRKAGYMAQLVSEQVVSMRASKLCFGNWLQMEKECAAKANAPSYKHPYCNTVEF